MSIRGSQGWFGALKSPQAELSKFESSQRALKLGSQSWFGALKLESSFADFDLGLSKNDENFDNSDNFRLRRAKMNVVFIVNSPLYPLKQPQVDFWGETRPQTKRNAFSFGELVYPRPNHNFMQSPAPPAHFWSERSSTRFHCFQPRNFDWRGFKIFSILLVLLHNFKWCRSLRGFDNFLWKLVLCEAEFSVSV